MEVKYNVTGERRKEMVEVISGIVGMKAVYMRMPTCAYAISNFKVSKEGTLIYDDRSDSEVVEKVLEDWRRRGLKPKIPQQKPQKLPMKMERQNYPANRKPSHRRQTWGLRWRFHGQSSRITL